MDNNIENKPVKLTKLNSEDLLVNSFLLDNELGINPDNEQGFSDMIACTRIFVQTFIDHNNFEQHLKELKP